MDARNEYFLILSTDDINNWKKILPATSSVFGSVEFASIYQGISGFKARLFVYHDRTASVAYPIFLRPVNSLPFVYYNTPILWDTVTPEYTGPIKISTQEDPDAKRFISFYDAYCQEEQIVAEFAHLNPWKNYNRFLEQGMYHFDREIVYVDLTKSEKDIWEKSLNHACRNSIKRASRENVRLREAQSISDIEEFYRIYIHTMNRNRALKKYYFPPNYFLEFFKCMPDNARFALAEYQNQIIAATLYMYDDNEIFAYLGGADYAFQFACPMNVLNFDTILWAKQKGIKRMVLGGGYKPDDGIFRFKASFSPLREKFFIYKKIHIPQAYDELCKAWSNFYSDDQIAGNIFPEYRSVPNS